VLESLEAQDFPRERFEVVLVDDGGPVPLDGIVAAYAGRLQIRLIRQRNAGCGPARQRGVDVARGACLAFTDDDCRPVPCWLSQLDAALSAHDGCAVCGPTVNALTGSLYAEASQRVVDLLSEWDRDADDMTAFAPTSNLAFPAAEFRRVGGLDIAWRTAGGEDRDLCARWRAAGYRMIHAGEAKVLHYHRLSTAGFLRQHFHYGRGALLFHRRAQSAGMVTYLASRPGFFGRLLFPPVRKYGFARAAGVGLAVALSQVATAAGLLAEGARRRAPLPDGAQQL
jgi:glycosyltransferase involved in cell wall biosynthesis